MASKTQAAEISDDDAIPEAERVEARDAAADAAETAEIPAVESEEAPEGGQGSAEAPEASGESENGPAVEPPAGTAFMDHPDPNASASYFGAEIVRGAEDLFLVPIHAIEHLVAHGFTLVKEAL